MASGNHRLIATIGAAAAASSVALVGAWEGLRNDPYLDLVGKRTVCFGETNVPMRRYSTTECKDMLAGSLNSYARTVLARNPELRGHPDQLTAAVSLAYNIGGSAYTRSTVARRFSEYRWREACDAILLWNRAGGRVVKGLTRRREAERSICLRGLT
jgi:lysozyme